MRIDGEIAKVWDLAHIPEHFNLRAGFQGVMDFVDGFHSLQCGFIICAFYAAQAACRARLMQALHEMLKRAIIQIRISPFDIM